MAYKEYLDGKEATKALQASSDEAFGDMQILAGHMYYVGKTPEEIRSYLNLIGEKAYEWLHNKVEQSGHGISEASDALIHNDMETYDKIIDDFDYAVEYKRDSF